MKKIKVNLKNSYDICIGDGVFFDFDFSKIKASGFLIVADEKVKNIFGLQIKKVFSGINNVSYSHIQALEKNKSFKTIEQIISNLVEIQADKQTIIVAIGGGIVGDLAGFAASIYMRGIRYIQVPTTLLAQVDSSIGGKTGVNLLQGKNLVGTIYQPIAVLSDTKFLESIGEKQKSEGMAEVIKYAVSQDKTFFDFLEKSKDFSPSFVERIIIKSVDIKAKIVSKDESEKDMREILNFGHTIGHAIETVSKNKISHGQAVAIGMLYEAKLAESLGMIKMGDILRLEGLIKKYNLPTSYKINAEKLIKTMKHDKKNKNGLIYFVLLSGIGGVKKKGSEVSFPVDEKIIGKFLDA